MSENTMIRTQYAYSKASPITDAKMGVAAKVMEWPPGEIIDRDLMNLIRELDELKDNACWLLECKEIHPVVSFNGTLVEVCGTVHNTISNIKEANQVFAAVKEAKEEEGGDDEQQQNDY